MVALMQFQKWEQILCVTLSKLQSLVGLGKRGRPRGSGLTVLGGERKQKKDSRRKLQLLNRSGPRVEKSWVGMQILFTNHLKKTVKALP